MSNIHFELFKFMNEHGDKTQDARKNVMHDMEKVIKGMAMCISQGECSPDDCPYYDRPRNESGLCWDRLMTDALALLKEQQSQIEILEYKLAVAENNLNHYINGND